MSGQMGATRGRLRIRQRTFSRAYVALGVSGQEPAVREAVEALEHTDRIRSDCDQIPERPDLVDGCLGREVREDGVEGDQVAVNVGHQCKPPDRTRRSGVHGARSDDTRSCRRLRCGLERPLGDLLGERDVARCGGDPDLIRHGRRRAVATEAALDEPLAERLLVQGALILAGGEQLLVRVGVPEARAIGRVDLIDQDDVVIDETELVLRVDQDQPALGRDLRTPRTTRS